MVRSGVAMRLHPLTHLPHHTVALVHLAAAALIAYLHYAPAHFGGFGCIVIGAIGLSVGRGHHYSRLSSL